MAGFSIDADRRVIPRWRTYDVTRLLGELDSIDSPPRHAAVISDFLASKVTDWRRNRTVGHASDLVGAGLTLGRETEVADAAQFLLRDDLSVSAWTRELADHALRVPVATMSGLNPRAVDQSALYARIRALRHLLHTEPKDPISWVDLALAYACLGLGHQANRCMTISLQLSDNNRFVLRSAGRLYIYLDDPERAHSVFIKSNRTRHDPWLLSAEIAIGSIAARPPRLVKAARRMLSGSRFLPSHLSELASAVATLDLKNGSVRKSKRLFQQSLVDPTENSIAQVAWAARQNRRIGFDHQFLSRPNTFEAESWIAFQEGRWERAVEQCKLWLFDQPFSSRPSTQGSFLAAVALEDYSTSEYFAKQGLIANPSDPTLLNNLAFSLISRDKFNETKLALSKIDRSKLSDLERAVLQATDGLFEFRVGHVRRGRELYSNAYSIGRQIKDGSQIMLLALAFTFHAIEEASVEANSKHVMDIQPLLDKALEAVRKAPAPFSGLLEEKLKKDHTPAG